MRRIAQLKNPRASRLTARALAMCVAALFAAAITASGVKASSFTYTYDWADTTYGAAGWDAQNQAPWYSASFTPGSGIKVAPTPNGSNPYEWDAAPGLTGGKWVFTAPGAAQITSAGIAGLSGKYDADQRQRIQFDGQGFAAIPAYSGCLLDPANNPVTWGRVLCDPGDAWNSEAFTLTPPPGASATELRLWNYPKPCHATGPPCQVVTGTDNPFGSLRRALITMDDPTTPNVTLAAATAGGWTRATSLPISASGSDTDSGIAQLMVIAKGAQGKRLTYRPDAKHKTPRQPGQPALRASRAFSYTMRLPNAGSVSISSRTVNGAGDQAASAPVTVQVDRARPVIRWPSQLKSGSRVQVIDAASGIQASSIDGAAGRCLSGSKNCGLVIPKGAEGQVTVVVTDAAGNTRRETRRQMIKRSRAKQKPAARKRAVTKKKRAVKRSRKRIRIAKSRRSIYASAKGKCRAGVKYLEQGTGLKVTTKDIRKRLGDKKGARRDGTEATNWKKGSAGAAACAKWRKAIKASIAEDLDDCHKNASTAPVFGYFDGVNRSLQGTSKIPHSLSPTCRRTYTTSSTAKATKSSKKLGNRLIQYDSSILPRNLYNVRVQMDAPDGTSAIPVTADGPGLYPIYASTFATPADARPQAISYFSFDASSGLGVLYDASGAPFTSQSGGPLSFSISGKKKFELAGGACMERDSSKYYHGGVAARFSDGRTREIWGNFPREMFSLTSKQKLTLEAAYVDCGAGQGNSQKTDTPTTPYSLTAGLSAPSGEHPFSEQRQYLSNSAFQRCNPFEPFKFSPLESCAFYGTYDDQIPPIDKSSGQTPPDFRLVSTATTGVDHGGIMRAVIPGGAQVAVLRRINYCDVNLALGPNTAVSQGLVTVPKYLRPGRTPNGVSNSKVHQVIPVGANTASQVTWIYVRYPYGPPSAGNQSIYGWVAEPCSKLPEVQQAMGN